MQRPPSTPTFYLTVRQPIRPISILLAILAAATALSSSSSPWTTPATTYSPATKAPPARPALPSDPAPKLTTMTNPSQIDTIVLGDPADAPVPARKGDHVSPVHPTILIRLPRYGPQQGLIPATPAGHLLYNWLAAFNQANYPALGNALPTYALSTAARAQMDLRQQTGGFNLLSAKEVQPGVLVFRLRDQTPTPTEVLGTLQLRPNSIPATIATFSLRAVPPPQPPSKDPSHPKQASAPKAEAVFLLRLTFQLTSS